MRQEIQNDVMSRDGEGRGGSLKTKKVAILENAKESGEERRSVGGLRKTASEELNVTIDAIV